MKWQRDVESTILNLLTAVLKNRHVGDCVWNDCMVWNLTATWCNNWVFCTQMFAYPWENISCHLFCRKTDISLWISLYLVSEVAVADKKRNYDAQFESQSQYFIQANLNIWMYQHWWCRKVFLTGFVFAVFYNSSIQIAVKLCMIVITPW